MWKGLNEITIHTRILNLEETFEIIQQNIYFLIEVMTRIFKV